MAFLLRRPRMRSNLGACISVTASGKSRVPRILSPDDLFVETSPSTQKRSFQVSRLYFLHRCLREAGGAGIAPVTTALGQKQEKFHAGRQKNGRRHATNLLPPDFV